MSKGLTSYDVLSTVELYTHINWNSPLIHQLTRERMGDKQPQTQHRLGGGGGGGGGHPYAILLPTCTYTRGGYKLNFQIGVVQVTMI